MCSNETIEGMAGPKDSTASHGWHGGTGDGRPKRVLAGIEQNSRKFRLISRLGAYLSVSASIEATTDAKRAVRQLLTN
jgi:hypothetical protein